MAEMAGPGLPVKLSSLHIENFRGFQRLEVQLEEQTVIIGANSSGKTSALWAIILFLRAFNTQMQKKPISSRPPFITTEELKEILNWENAKTLPLVFNTTTTTTTNTKFSLVGTFEGGNYPTRVQFEFEANGYLKILGPPVDSDSRVNDLPKARFAFVGCGEPYFCAGAKESRDISRLSSSMGTSRSLFDALSDEFKGAIRSFMDKVFGICEINKDNFDLILKETHGIEIEIMFAGSATRKVFATLVLLYTLAQANTHPMRVLAVEEPEALLYPSIAFAFISHLSLECQKHKIQLVLSSTAYSLVNSSGCFASVKLLSLGMLKQIDSSMGEVINAELLGSLNHKILVLCEGAHDVMFIRHVAEIFLGSQQAHKVLGSISFHHLSSALTKDKVAKDIIARVEKDWQLSVRAIRDKDFKTKVTTSPMSNLKTWDLPSIESYIFVCYCQTLQKANKNPLQFLQDSSNLITLMAKYMTCVASQSPEDSSAATNAFISVSKLSTKPTEQQTIADYKEVALVLHGHTWVGIINKKMLELLKLYVTKENMEAVPIVKEIVIDFLLKD